MSPEGARGPELRATWARLEIHVGNETVTTLEDTTARSVLGSVFAPLYPVAEWMATNWWFLLHEVEGPGRTGTAQFERRHNLRFGGEGFALPTLRFLPDGEQVLLVWAPDERPDCEVRFLRSGTARLPRAEVSGVLGAFITSVLARLDAEKVQGTLLSQEWAAICAGPEDEAEFCRLSAALGQDPYNLEPGQSEALVQAVSSLPPCLLQEFCSAAPWSRLSASATELGRLIEAAAGGGSGCDALARLRGEAAGVNLTLAPHEQGYGLARTLRSRLELNGQPIRSVHGLGGALGVPATPWEEALAGRIGKGLGFLDALVAVSNAGIPRFFLPHRREAPRLFALCRAICESLSAPSDTAAIVTPSHSVRQKRNRAFAAEFLAPAEEIGERLSGSVVSEDEIVELASDYGVSPIVIRYQIENHALARILPWPR
jgi:hypothetical protein